jgi:hypothetical protein
MCQLQRLQNRELRAIGNLDRCTPARELQHVAFTIPYVYGYITASIFNIQILELFQLKALLMIVDAPWYVPNTVIRRNLQTPTV